MSVGPRSEKFSVASNDHGRTQKGDFCVSVGKTNFADHDTSDTINGLGIQFYVKCITATARYARISSISSSGLLIKRCKRQAFAKQTTSKWFLKYLAVHILIQIV